MPGNSNIRCLHCWHGSEQSVLLQIEERGLGMALYPEKVEPFVRGDVWRDVKKPLLPGYVFVFASQPYPVRMLLEIEGVLRVLTYGSEDKEGYLDEQDSRFARWLLENDGVVPKLQAVQEGSYVRIVDGLLRDYSGRVEKVNRQQRMAYISLNIVGSTRHIWLGYEYIQKLAQDLPY